MPQKHTLLQRAVQLLIPAGITTLKLIKLDLPDSQAHVVHDCPGLTPALVLVSDRVAVAARPYPNEHSLLLSSNQGCQEYMQDSRLFLHRLQNRTGNSHKLPLSKGLAKQSQEDMAALRT